MKILIIVLIFILLFCWSIFLWDRFTPEMTQEQLKIKSYYRCVDTQYINGRDVNNCNYIK